MKGRELIKPDLESPFTKLCKPEIAPTTINRGLKSTEEQNCFPRNKTCQKNLARIFRNAPIVAYRKDKPFKDLYVRARIPTLSKLFGDELSKQLKELTEVSRVGKQLQKKAPEQKRFYQKPYDRPRHTSNRKAFMGKKPLLAYSRATFQ